MHADFASRKLRHMQLRPAALAFLFHSVGRIGREPHPPRTRFDIRQIQFGPAFLRRMDEAVQPQLAAHRPIHADSAAAFDAPFEQPADFAFGGGPLVSGQLRAGAAQTAAQFRFFLISHFSDGLLL